MQRNNYRNINQFGKSLYSEVSSPTTYCLNDTLSQRFLHGGNSTIYGQNSQFCQRFWGEYCAQEWDDLCEVASKNTNNTFPNSTTFGNINNRTYNYKGLSSGDMVIRNTAANKYLVAMGDCVPKYEPFDPTVADSPMIKYWVSGSGQNACVPVYDVNPVDIDNDVVMDKILANPKIALDILINIFNTHKREYGSVDDLKDTKLGRFFAYNPNIFVDNTNNSSSFY